MQAKKLKTQPMRRYVLTLAGGSGKRLWPLSRVHQPKQLLPFYGTTTLLEKTIERMQLFAPREQHIVVTTKQQEEHTRNLVGNSVGRFIIESVSRNTAPAILLSCLELSKYDNDAVIICVPADHVIGDNYAFAQAIKTACVYAEQHKVITLIGVKPRHAATEYGYIEIGAQHESKEEAPLFLVNRFHEKPSAEVAEWYYQSGNMLWNSGIICARISTLLQEFAQHAPELIANIHAYEQLPSCSIDYALLEKSSHVAVVQGEFAWSDVGNLATFIASYHGENAQEKNISVWGAQNNKAYTKKAVVFAGVEDICVIETEDLLFIGHQKAADRSAEIAEYLVQQGFQEYT